MVHVKSREITACPRLQTAASAKQEAAAKLAGTSTFVQSGVSNAANFVAGGAVRKAKQTRNWVIGVALAGLFFYGVGQATPGAVSSYLQFKAKQDANPQPVASRDDNQRKT
jgi:hypothetical protein